MKGGKPMYQAGKKSAVGLTGFRKKVYFPGKSKQWLFGCSCLSPDPASPPLGSLKFLLAWLRKKEGKASYGSCLTRKVTFLASCFLPFSRWRYSAGIASQVAIGFFRICTGWNIASSDCVFRLADELWICFLVKNLKIDIVHTCSWS